MISTVPSHHGRGCAPTFAGRRAPRGWIGFVVPTLLAELHPAIAAHRSHGPPWERVEVVRATQMPSDPASQRRNSDHVPKLLVVPSEESRPSNARFRPTSFTGPAGW